MKDLGYNEENGIYQCEFCRFTTEKGQVYPIEDENKFFEAWRFMEHHIKTEHHSVLMALLAKGKEEHGLSQQQVELISLFYQGKKDSDIQKELGIASLSTLRNHRFNLRKKERQAQNFLRIMAFLKDDEQQKNPTKFTKEQDYFTHNGQFIRYPKGKKVEFVILEKISLHFQVGKKYSEKEINQVLSKIYPEDHALLRRRLIDMNFLQRDLAGTWYEKIEGEKHQMDYKKELKMQAKEVKIEGGIYQIKNTKNGKRLIASTPNLKSLNGLKFSLKNKSYINKQLQEEWTAFGEEVFEFKVLEVVTEKELEKKPMKKILEQKLETWLEKEQPYDETGYITKKE